MKEQETSLQDSKFEFAEFEQTINSLPEDERQEVLQQFEKCYELMAEANVLYTATIKFLKFKHQQNGSTSNNEHDTVGANL